MTAQPIDVSAWSHDERKDRLSASAIQNAWFFREKAKQLRLKCEVYDFPELLADTKSYEDQIEACARQTLTKYEHQLKFIAASDAPLDRSAILRAKRSPNVVIGVVPYGTDVSFKGLANAMINAGMVNNTFSPNKLSSHWASPENLMVESGMLGFDKRGVRHPHYYPKTHDYDAYVEGAPTPYVIDTAVKELGKIAFPVGRQLEGSALIVLSDPLDRKPFKNRLDLLLSGAS
jgi:hypothetical protein